jgi:hypothetical protein
MSDREPTEEDVLFAYAAEPSHDLATLERYLQRYPQFLEGLIDCSIEMEISPPPEGLAELVPAPATAWERFEAAMAKVPPVANPFARLDSGAFRALAAELGMNALLLMRFRDRAIVAATIPLRVINQMAAKLHVSSDDMVRYFGTAPAMAEGMQFKAVGKPAVAAQIAFAEAVRTSQLTDGQQKQLLALTS